MTGPAAFALLHGGGQGSWVWDDTARALEARGARVQLLDVPGCGTMRGRATIELSVDEVVDELAGELATGLGRAVLVGHSQAGTLLPLLWQRHPRLIARMIYVSACAPLPGQSVLDMMGTGLRGTAPDEVGWPLDPETHDKNEQRLLTLCSDMPPAQARAFLTRLDQDSWPLAVTIWPHWSYDHLPGAPGSYIVCERDGILPTPWQERFAERLHATGWCGSMPATRR